MNKGKALLLPIVTAMEPIAPPILPIYEYPAIVKRPNVSSYIVIVFELKDSATTAIVWIVPIW